MQSILIVDDEKIFRDRLAKAFAVRGFTCHTARSYEEALEEITEHLPAMAVVDLKMPGRSGLDLIPKAKEIHPALRIVVLTGYGSIATATEAIRLGALNYLPKPADVDDILAAFAIDEEGETIPAPDDFNAPSLARAEWEHIQRVLADCGGNISATADRLGIHRRTLQRKLQKNPPSE